MKKTVSKNRFSEVVDLSQPSLKIIFRIFKNYLESNQNKKNIFIVARGLEGQSTTCRI
jgi:hypothetical protein